MHQSAKFLLLTFRVDSTSIKIIRVRVGSKRCVLCNIALDKLNVLSSVVICCFVLLFFFVLLTADTTFRHCYFIDMARVIRIPRQANDSSGVLCCAHHVITRGGPIVVTLHTVKASLASETSTGSQKNLKPMPEKNSFCY